MPNQQPDIGEILADPVMSEMDAMMNGAANAIAYKHSDGIRFLCQSGRIVGIWVRAFPSNTTRRAFLSMFCALEGQDSSQMAVLAENYQISKDAVNGGVNVRFGNPVPRHLALGRPNKGLL